ncbi:MAG: serine/threonine protein kinase [Labilithrix sp.]|nr:serine/threonine protein kinase [Labilithrix sp.]
MTSFVAVAMVSSKRRQLRPEERLELGDGRHVQLLDVIGKGASATVQRGVVCAAYGVRRPVAVKLFESVSSDEAEHVRQTLARTVRRVACVHHPNVAGVYECGDWRGRPFLVSELVAGVSLAKLQEAHASKKRRIPLDLALFIAAEVAEGLAGARVARDHEGVQLGVVHHALSAREVLLSWLGEVKVSDFETSTARAATSSIRSLRGVASRASTMAPEVARGLVADARSDVFSFGVLLRELLVGPRFPGGLTNSEAIRLAREGYVQPMTFQPHLPAGLESVMFRALEVDPEARYPNACALAFDLRRVVLSMGVGDGRYFLRKALEREWSQYAEEITAPRFIAPAANDDDGYEPYDGELVALEPREKRRR